MLKVVHYGLLKYSFHKLANRLWILAGFIDHFFGKLESYFVSQLNSVSYDCKALLISLFSFVARGNVYRN